MADYLISLDYFFRNISDETVSSLEADDIEDIEDDALEILQDILNHWDDNEDEEDIDEGIGLVDDIYERAEIFEFLQTHGLQGSYMFETVD
jgi:hypothetical protein